ncbi:hypothetical protein FANTH_10151 [Fusarium anthophilum]|uniref:Cytochrome P450 n=1 Tax=Fusarium anthophilum TaxID=48485 RepID=A0A8H4Z2U2_9HYPO|nr:hypothetical protein FANTH_10151 [Fusarium anthophilum]
MAKLIVSLSEAVLAGMSNTYSPPISIVVNSASVAKELMDKRGSKYSSRPRMPMEFEATFNQNREIFMAYGDRWRTLRKLSHGALNFNISATYKPVQDFESKQVIHLRPPPADWSDPYIRKIHEVLVHFTLMSEPGRWLVDAFPSLASLPPVLVQNRWNIGRKWFEEDREVYLKLYRELVQQIKEGTAPDCFLKDFYEGGLEKSGISEEQDAYAAGTLIEAGSESTSTVINAWILNCQLNPHVITAGQEELDRVVGSDRMPAYDDEDNLPYIRAMVKETLRLWPITKPGMNR